MHQTVQNLIQIKEEIKGEILKNNIGDYEPNVIAVSKTFKIEHISHLIDFGHFHYGENKVQEALEKWSNIKQNNKFPNAEYLSKTALSLPIWSMMEKDIAERVVQEIDNFYK